MGTYKIDDEEFINRFEEFLRDFEGEVDVETLVIAWNKLSRKYKWNEYLEVRK